MMTASGDFMVKLSDSKHRGEVSWQRLPKVPLHRPRPGVEVWKPDEAQLAQVLDQYARRARGTPLAGIFAQPQLYIKLLNSLQSLYEKHGCLLGWACDRQRGQHARVLPWCESVCLTQWRTLLRLSLF